jgi:hypothetical protein
MTSNSDTCAICLDNLINSPHHTTKCNHAFHTECIREWQKRSDRCPMCREDTSTSTSRCIDVLWLRYLIHRSFHAITPYSHTHACLNRTLHIRHTPVRIQHIWFTILLFCCIVLFPGTLSPEPCSADTKTYSCTCTPFRVLWFVLIMSHVVCACTAIWSRVIRRHPITYHPNTRICIWIAYWLIIATFTASISFANGPLVYYNSRIAFSACGLDWMATQPFPWIIVTLSGLVPGLYIMLLTLLYIRDSDADSVYITW